MKTRIMVVDDEGLFRDMLTTTLALQPTLEVVGSASSGSEAIKAAQELRPDVVLMDIELGSEPNGIEAAHAIRKLLPGVGIIVLSGHAEREYLRAIPTDQANGWSYLTKGSISDLATLVRAISSTAAGLMVLDPVLIRSLKPTAAGALSGLSRRQIEVLELMAQGYNNSGIAKQLYLSEKSVENYVNGIYQHLLIAHDEPIHPRVKAVLAYLENTRVA